LFVYNAEQTSFVILQWGVKYFMLYFMFLGILERPVEILDRKRDRKSTDRLALEKYTQPKTPKEELDFDKVF